MPAWPQKTETEERSRRQAMRKNEALSRRGLLAGATVAATATWLPWAVGAPAWPDRPIKIIVPFAAGGTGDAVARLLAEQLAQRLGQPVVVEARAGANGTIGAQAVARSAPDGLTLLLNSSAQAINAGLYRKLPYDTERDFVAVAPVVAPGPFVVVVHPSLPVHDIGELLAYARAHPGQVSYGSAGIGNALHLAGEMLGQMGGVKLLHVPYKGAAPILNDLVGNQIQMMFSNPMAVQAFVQNGKLRLLAQTGATRLATLPDLPTVAEAGLPGFELTSWYGLYAPAGTPGAVVQRLNEETLRGMNQPAVMERLSALVTGPLPATPPRAFEAFTHREIERYASVIQRAGITLDLS
ncbi:MAG: tripartite tricarboxylate transporter substrate binding protein [Comamonas sp.]